MKFKLKSLLIAVTISACLVAIAREYRQQIRQQNVEYWLPDSYWEEQGMQKPTH